MDDVGVRRSAEFQEDHEVAQTTHEEARAVASL